MMHRLNPNPAQKTVMHIGVKRLSKPRCKLVSACSRPTSCCETSSFATTDKLHLSVAQPRILSRPDFRTELLGRESFLGRTSGPRKDSRSSGSSSSGEVVSSPHHGQASRLTQSCQAPVKRARPCPAVSFQACPCHL